MSPATLLLAALVVPLVGAALVWTFPDREPGLARGLGIFVALVEAAVLLALLARFDPGGPSTQLEAAWVWNPSLGLAPRFGLDGLSVPAIGALALVVPLGLLAGTPADQGAKGERTGRAVGAALVAQAAAVGILLARDAGTLSVCWLLELAATWLLVTSEGDDEARRLADRRLVLGAAGGLALLAAAVMLSVLHYDLSQGQHGFGPEALQSILPPPTLQALLLAATLLATWTRLGQWPFHGATVGMAEHAGPSSAIQVLGLGPALAIAPLWKLGIPAAPLIFGEWAPMVAGLGVFTLAWCGIASIARPGRPAQVLGGAAVGQGGIALMLLACATTAAWLGLAVHVAGIAVAVTAAVVVLPALRDHGSSRPTTCWRLGDLPVRRPGLYVALVLGGAGLVGAPLLAAFAGLWTGFSALMVGDSVELPEAHVLGLVALLGLAVHAAAWMRVAEGLRRPGPDDLGSRGVRTSVPPRASWATLVAVGLALGGSLAIAARPAQLSFAAAGAAREDTLELHRRRCRAIVARELDRPVEIDRVVADCRAPKLKIIEAYGLELRRSALSFEEADR